MAKRKIGILAQIVTDLEKLSDDELQILADVTHSRVLNNRAMTRAERMKTATPKPTQKRKTGREAAAVGSTSPDWCRKCSRPLDDNIHQLNTRADYHEFVEPAGEAKGAAG